MMTLLRNAVAGCRNWWIMETGGKPLPIGPDWRAPLPYSDGREADQGTVTLAPEDRMAEPRREARDAGAPERPAMDPMLHEPFSRRLRVHLT